MTFPRKAPAVFIDGDLVGMQFSASKRRAEFVAVVHLVENQAEQAAMTQVRDLRSAGLSLRGVVTECEPRGLASRSGRPFALTQIARMCG